MTREMDKKTKTHTCKRLLILTKTGNEPMIHMQPHGCDVKQGCCSKEARL